MISQLARTSHRSHSVIFGAHLPSHRPLEITQVDLHIPHIRVAGWRREHPLVGSGTCLSVVKLKTAASLWIAPPHTANTDCPLSAPQHSGRDTHQDKCEADWRIMSAMETSDLCYVDLKHSDLSRADQDAFPKYHNASCKSLMHGGRSAPCLDQESEANTSGAWGVNAILILAFRGFLKEIASRLVALFGKAADMPWPYTSFSSRRS
ncbi:hypothetical protein DFH29DRAFT_871542 [Suillus ampliporus]|nr:hypothetical protein DFH29DRAFT_871542 [Suillus ampliporus]